MKKSLVYRRKNRKNSSEVEALNYAQQIVFAPFTFQVIGTMLDFGILQKLDNENLTQNQIMQLCTLDEYCANVLLQAAEYAHIIQKSDDGKFSLTKAGECFLHDEMTVKNFTFMRDVCYLGANELTLSLKNSEPVGLQKFFVDDKTIYPHVPTLPQKAKKSWYEFDHYYSDGSFEDVLKIIFENSPATIFDIGGNTGKFELACLKFDKKTNLRIIDLPVNKDIALENTNSNRVEFIPFDVLSGNDFPKIFDTVFMSQFLDCFSKEQAINILKGIQKSAEPKTKIFILEPVIDNQIFECASFSLAHISLYFTCLANGNSKMYTQNELLEIIRSANLKLNKIHNNVGKHCYTLLECETI